MSRISMDHVRLTEISSGFAKQGNILEEVITEMNSLTAQAAEEWQGAAATSFAQEYQDLLPSFKNMRQLAEDVSKQLSDSAKAVRELDEKMAGSFGV